MCLKELNGYYLLRERRRFGDVRSVGCEDGVLEHKVRMRFDEGNYEDIEDDRCSMSAPEFYLADMPTTSLSR